MSDFVTEPLPPSNAQREELLAASKRLREAKRAFEDAERDVLAAQQDYDMRHDFLVGHEQAWNEYVATAEMRWSRA